MLKNGKWEDWFGGKGSCCILKEEVESLILDLLSLSFPARMGHKSGVGKVGGAVFFSLFSPPFFPRGIKIQTAQRRRRVDEGKKKLFREQLERNIYEENFRSEKKAKLEKYLPDLPNKYRCVFSN